MSSSSYAKLPPEWVRKSSKCNLRKSESLRTDHASQRVTIQSHVLHYLRLRKRRRDEKENANLAMEEHKS
eukprot:4860522-Pyramimonas_sp.AAC.1